MDHMTNDLQAFACVWSVAMWRLAERMLYDLDQVLRAHGIRVFMVYGTFLGAIRHHGVIPWDDDIDIGILGKDESRLLHARGDLRNRGYQLKQHKLPWDHNTLKYYKVWIASRPSCTGYFYSWPFVDIWVLRPTGRLNEITDGALLCHRSDILPLQSYPFGNLSLDGPCSDDLLVQSYGTEYLDRCVSSNLNHREEKRLRPVSKSRECVQRHGYFVQVHARDSVNDCSKLAQNATYQLKRSNLGNDLVSQTGHVYRITSTAAALWDLSDGTRTIRDMLERLSDCFSVPVVDLVEDVYSSVKALHAHGVVRIS
jgi:hypothetical protein